MGFAAFAPLIGAGVSGLASASGGKGGGQSSSSGNQAIDIRNFAGFQQPALNGLFGALTGDVGENGQFGGVTDDSLLRVPGSATSAVDNALKTAQGLLGNLARFDPLGDLQGARQIATDDLSKQPFEEANKRFEDIFSRAGSLTDAELARDPTALVKSLLLPTAEGEFLPGQPNSNKFFESGVVQPALNDARNQIATLFTNSGRLNSPSAGQTVARETGRLAGGLRSNQFNLERGNQLNASQAIGSFDQNEGIRRLNAINAGNSAQLNATQGIQSTIAADEQRRLGLLGLRSGISGQQLGLQNSLISNTLPSLATAQTSLPFVPLSNFANIASLPLARQGTVTDLGTAQAAGPGGLSQLAGGALVGKGLFGDPGGSLLSGDIFGGGGKGGSSAPIGGLTGLGLGGQSGFTGALGGSGLSGSSLSFLGAGGSSSLPFNF